MLAGLQYGYGQPVTRHCILAVYACWKGENLAFAWFGPSFAVGALLPCAHSGVGVYSMHPGWADTEGVRTSIPGFHSAFQAKLRDAAQGCDTIVWLALEDAAKLQPGAFYLDRQAQTKHLTLGGTKYSKEQAAELYQKVLDMAGLKQEAVRAATGSAAGQLAADAVGAAPEAAGGDAAAAAEQPTAADSK